MTKQKSRRTFRYEHRSQPMLPRRLFFRRIIYHVLLALVVVSVSLVIGVLGYRFLAGLSWIDALMNAAMQTISPQSVLRRNLASNDKEATKFMNTTQFYNL